MDPDTSEEAGAATEVVLPLPSTLSPSKISTFTSCGLQFRFSAIDRLPDPSGLAAVRGTFVHRALQLLMRLDGPERTRAAADDCLAQAEAELDDDPEFAELSLTDDERERFMVESAELMDNYFQMEDPTTVNAVGLEVMVAAEVDGLVLRGIIDRLDRLDDGSFVVVDYKSGKAPREGFERGRLQGVQMYALLCEHMFGVRPVEVRLMYLGDGQTIRVEPTERSVRGVERKAAAIWKTVVRAHQSDSFKPNRGPLCNWCAFQRYCPEFGGSPDEARVEALALREASKQD